MSKLKYIALALSVLIAVCGCGENLSSPNPATSSALAQMPVKERRIAIVHSESSKLNYYDPFDYNQLFAAMQHQAVMAGLPFDLLSETELSTATNLSQYSAVVLPNISHVATANREPIRRVLMAAQQSGVGIVTSGEFLAFNQNGDYFADTQSVLGELLGLRTASFLSDVPATVTITTNQHPATVDYLQGEQLLTYEQIWFGNYVPLTGEEATTLTTVTVAGETYAGAQIVNRNGRVVHFANEQIMADNKLLWSILQWVVYGDVAPVTLQVSRNDSVFIGRNDMDLAMFPGELPSVHVPLLSIIKDWKRDYNFVGSYYIDIGNHPAAGQFTNWAVSAPLYTQYIALGNEVGTHSWTHPQYVSSLNSTQLEFEFNQSKAEISTQLGVPVVGGAIPGNPESLEVVESLNQWFDYFSGRSGEVGIGYPNAFGFLEPQHNMLYFSLNMTADFELIDVLNKTPEQAQDLWREQFDRLSTHVSQPIMHWLWHDYGPTTQAAAGTYSKAMFEQTVAYAHSKGAEFTTVDELHKRIRSFKDIKLTIGAGSVIEATVDSSAVGQFALKLGAGHKIRNVANWYAYDDDQVFLADDGGRYQIAVGGTADPVTRVSKLPMRARLLSLNGDGDELSFTFSGQGEVSVRLSPGMQGNVRVSGADSFSENTGVLTLKFNNDTTHAVSLTAVTPINRAPVAAVAQVQTVTAKPVDLVLSGTDVDGDALTYTVQSQPSNGTLSGNPPALVYRSRLGFSGIDTFAFTVNDGALESAPAIVEVQVDIPLPANSAPVANRLVLASLINQPLAFRLTGSDNENQQLTFSVSVSPQSGTVTGTPPDLVYTPNADFSGIDELTFIANDGSKDSASAKVVFNVEPGHSAGGGTISNFIDTIVVDGALDDWSAITPFGSDADDITGANNSINWRAAWMGHDATNLYLAYQNYGPVSLSWGYSIFLDTDTDDTTGFRGFSNSYTIGADYLLEGDSLFRFTSLNQNQWSWELVGSVNSSVVTDGAELSFARELIGNPTNLRLFFQGDSAAAGGTSVDFFPDDVSNETAILKSRRFSYSVNPNVDIENTAPVANSQIINTTNNANLEIVLTGSDLNADSLVFEVLWQPAHGALTGTAPVLVYSPDIAYTGEDALTFTVNDGAIVSNPATVKFNVVEPPAINSMPVANGQAVTTVANVPLEITLAGSDADGDVLGYVLVTPPNNGALTGIAPALTYTAATGFTGMDSFTFKVNDGDDDSATAIVEITVNQGQIINSAPIANAQNLTTAFDTALGVQLTGSDAEDDPLTFSVASPPLSGTLQGTPPQLTYVPNAGISGIDSFTIVVNDGQLSSAPATISLEVLAEVLPNRPPVANGQTLTTPFGQSIPVILTGTDPDGSSVSFNVMSQPAGGTLTGTLPDLLYSPTVAFSGLDSFRFTASDGELNSVEATVTIDVGERVTGAISNLVDSIVVDGKLGDWSGVASFGLDPDDVSGPTNPLDWREVWIAHDARNLYLAFRNDQAFQLSWGHGIYVDVDGNPDTGFRGFQGEFPIGADYLIESDDIQKYTGTGANWSWVLEGVAATAVSGDVGEVMFPRALLGNPVTPKFYLRADNEPFGGFGVDHYPDAALDPNADAASRSLSYSTTP